MKNISTLYIMKRLLVSIAIVFISILTVAGQNHSFSLSGKWNFQIDREDAGMKEQWFNKSLDESINLPGSMPEKLKGDEVTVRTQWTGSLYDSSYYFNPYMEKYRMEHIVHLVVVNSDLTIKRGQDVIGKPKEQNFKKEMENLEIIL